MNIPVFAHGFNTGEDIATVVYTGFVMAYFHLFSLIHEQYRGIEVF